MARVLPKWLARAKARWPEGANQFAVFQGFGGVFRARLWASL
jgi:hypothetical protein